MRRLVVVEHQVDGVCRSANKYNLKDGVVEAFRLIKCP